jgi:hypothetical protein
MVCQAKESNKAHHKVFIFAETGSYGAFHARSFVLSHNFFYSFKVFTVSYTPIWVLCQQLHSVEWWVLGKSCHALQQN